MNSPDRIQKESAEIPAPSGTDDQRHRRRYSLATVSLLSLSAAVILAGQVGLDLLTMDDFREAEVAREMLETGDFVVPHLAGLPFVEKPPGFQLVVAIGYLLAGGPSVPAARLVSAGFALLSLTAVFLLGKRISGPLPGAAASLVLATALQFCQTAHTILLDNALTAALAWALYFTWEALEAENPRSKQRWYAGALFSVGLSFLFKGFVGPALFAAGALAYLLATRRWNELRHAFRPLGLAAFLIPPLAWVLPFVLRSPGPLLYEFFISNHFGRALHAYQGHARPFYFYGLTIWGRFAPGSLLLPFAARAAWMERNQTRGRAGFFFLAFSVGTTTLLSLSTAKDHAYLLPVYPALACLVACWGTRLFEGTFPESRRAAALFGLSALLFLAGMVGFGVYVHHGIAAASIVGLVGLGAGALALFVSVRRGNPGMAAWSGCVLVSAASILYYIPPVSTWYVQRPDPRPCVKDFVDATRDTPVLLFDPDDRLRGGCGFYRGRTIEEVPDPKMLISRLQQNPSVRAAIWLLPLERYHPDLLAEVARAGLTLTEEQRIAVPGHYPIGLYSLHEKTLKGNADGQ